MTYSSNVRTLRNGRRAEMQIFAHLIWGDKVEPTIICDVSENGIGLFGCHSVAPGDAVIIRLASGQTIDARVTWRTSTRCGLLASHPHGPLKLSATAERMPVKTTADDGVRASPVDTPLVPGFFGASEAMQRVYHQIRLAAQSNAPVFISGESGTGKELCAAAIHALSPRNKSAFVAVNCAALPAQLFESEMFGHKKGAFTGAIADREGAAMRANGGTLFLDEIGEADAATQVKLLRFLQSGTVTPVGIDEPRVSDARLVFATNRDIRHDVTTGKMREDFFYRIHVLTINMPAMRERGDDIVGLARNFLEHFTAKEGRAVKGFSDATEVWMKGYDWPGNVRQLQNAVHACVAFSDGRIIELEEFKRCIADVSSSGCTRGAALVSEGDNSILPLDDVISAAIDRAIKICGSSIPKAAFALGVSPSTIYRHLQSRRTAI